MDREDIVILAISLIVIGMVILAVVIGVLLIVYATFPQFMFFLFMVSVGLIGGGAYWIKTTNA